jgi:RHS repeat-associated protein
VRATAYNSGLETISYYPYGQERPQGNGLTTADGRDKFGTYFRDGIGQDYADQRYYNQAGRFFSPDPGGLSTADPTDPGSWNRYAYVGGDPVSFRDPHGRVRCTGCGDDGNDGEDPCDEDPLACIAQSGTPTGGVGQTYISDGSGAINLDLLKSLKSKLDAILANQDCAGIFGKAPGLLGFGTSSTPTASNVLDSLIDGSSGGASSPYGSFQFVDPSNGTVIGGLLGAMLP